MFRKALFISLLLLVSVFSLAQTETKNKSAVAEYNAQVGFNDSIDRLADDFIEAYLSIAEPGDYLYTTLGHAAFHLKCPTFDLDYYFSMEGENRPDAVWQFLAGKLKMGMLIIPSEMYLKTPYIQDQRGVKEYKLNLTPLQKLKLWEILDRYAQEWQDLPYDYFHNSCAVVWVDIMNEVVGKENLHYPDPWPAKFEYSPRQLVYYALQGRDEWTQFFICLVAGNEVDKNIDKEHKLIVPKDLLEVWQNTSINDRPLLDKEPIVIVPNGERNTQSRCTPIVISLVLLVLSISSFISCWLKSHWCKIYGRIIDYFILGVVTLIGLFLTYLLFFSHLPCTNWNWLFIAFNPLPALLWHWRRFWGLPYVGIQIGWCVVMLYLLYTNHLLALWPHIILSLTFSVTLIHQSCDIKNNKKI